MLEKYEGDPIGEIEKYEARGKQLEKKLVNPEKRESVSKRGGNGCFRMHALRFSQKKNPVKMARTSIFHPNFCLSAPNCPHKS